jgi:hypothetical protein
MMKDFRGSPRDCYPSYSVTKAKVETLESLEAGEGKSKHMTHNGLIAHLYTQTAEGL